MNNNEIYSYKSQTPFVCEVCSTRFNKGTYLKIFHTHNCYEIIKKRQFNDILQSAITGDLSDVVSCSPPGTDTKINDQLTTGGVTLQVVNQVPQESADSGDVQFSYVYDNDHLTQAAVQSLNGEVTISTFESNQIVIVNDFSNEVVVGEKTELIDNNYYNGFNGEEIIVDVPEDVTNKSNQCKTNTNNYNTTCTTAVSSVATVTTATSNLNSTTSTVNNNLSLQQSDSKQYICRVCNGGFLTYDELQTHMILHSDVFNRCDKCDKSFKTQDLLNEHILSHNDKRYKCNICDTTFLFEFSLNCHQCVDAQIENNSGPESLLTLNPLLKPIVELPVLCDHCGIVIYSNVKEHIRSHRKLYECDKCDADFDTIKQLENHNEKHENHGERRRHRAKIKPEDYQYKCPVCSNRYVSHAKLRYHVNKHVNGTKSICSLCNNVFHTELLLQRHIIQVHAGERPFQCNVCSNSFIDVSSLKRHKVVHSNDRPFKCKICTSAFKASENLKRHLTTHAETRPFKCNYCSKSFRLISKLEIHMATHRIVEGELKECKFCLKKFANDAILTRHLRTHTNEEGQDVKQID